MFCETCSVLFWSQIVLHLNSAVQIIIIYNGTLELESSDLMFSGSRNWPSLRSA